MTEPLTILGKEIEKSSDGSYFLAKGVLFLDVYPQPSTVYGAAISIGGIRLVARGAFAAKEPARDWLESEARRIAREMVEMAGPLESVNSTLEHSINRTTPVRFRDD
jgi:hypothetical protein